MPGLQLSRSLQELRGGGRPVISRAWETQQHLQPWSVYDSVLVHTISLQTRRQLVFVCFTSFVCVCVWLCVVFNLIAQAPNVSTTGVPYLFLETPAPICLSALGITQPRGPSPCLNQQAEQPWNSASPLSPLGPSATACSSSMGPVSRMSLLTQAPVPALCCPG